MKATASCCIARLKETLDCKKCTACLFRDCKLAVSLRTKEFLFKGAEKQAEFEKWQLDLRRSTLPEGNVPKLSDFEDAHAAWGRA